MLTMRGTGIAETRSGEQDEGINQGDMIRTMSRLRGFQGGGLALIEACRALIGRHVHLLVPGRVMSALDRLPFVGQWMADR